MQAASKSAPDLTRRASSADSLQRSRSGSGSGSDTGLRTSCSVGRDLLGGSKRQAHKRAAEFACVVHCGSVRQLARLVSVQEVQGQCGSPAGVGMAAPPGMSEHALGVCGSIRCAAALLHAAHEDDEETAADGDLCSVAQVRFRFVHRAEWLREGSRLIVRDRGDGHVAAAGLIRRAVLG
jgi:hypothetical protein